MKEGIFLETRIGIIKDIKEDNKYERLRESFSERAYSLADISKWLDETGFDVVGVYDDMTENKPSEMSERVYFSAVKR